MDDTWLRALWLPSRPPLPHVDQHGRALSIIRTPVSTKTTTAPRHCKHEHHLPRITCLRAQAQQEVGPEGGGTCRPMHPEKSPSVGEKEISGEDRRHNRFRNYTTYAESGCVRFLADHKIDPILSILGLLPRRSSTERYKHSRPHNSTLHDFVHDYPRCPSSSSCPCAPCPWRHSGSSCRSRSRRRWAPS